MERGNLAGASDQVLEGVADALQLDDAEREHLRSLAEAAGPPRPAGRGRPPAPVRPVIQQVLDAITDAPAWVRNARHDIIAMNLMARALYSPVLTSAAGRSDEQTAGEHHPISLPRLRRPRVLHRLRPDGHGRRRHASPGSRRHPHDKDLTPWSVSCPPNPNCSGSTGHRRNVKFHRSGRKRLRHPAVGELDLNFEAMELPSDSALQLNIYTADPDTPTADGLKILGNLGSHQGPSSRQR